MSDRPETRVQLGCGTLIVIAIIVMIFSGDRDSSRLRKRIDELNHKVDRLEQKIDSLSRKLDRPAAPPHVAPPAK